MAADVAKRNCSIDAILGEVMDLGDDTLKLVVDVWDEGEDAVSDLVDCVDDTTANDDFFEMLECIMKTLKKSTKNIDEIIKTLKTYGVKLSSEVAKITKEVKACEKK